ncbi:MAG: L-glutamate gamma-semialdehyde dehydrogenase [Candidatus Melainabacteria bacterium RIFCSPLOWO2_02_FULL_35_15]|nr:MAG: L-glutamate gamma-semialdehyde dehydrogenase [Candidatus Melainabacteria bacterium RIFCSPLOWO2_02_FULL_35_15]
MDTSLEAFECKVKKTGKLIFQRVKSSQSLFFDRSFWSTKLMELGMKDQMLKTELFRFVDVLPSLNTNEQLLKHINEYFGSVKGEYADLIKSLTAFGTGNILGKMAASFAIKAGVSQMAKTFIAGGNVKEVFLRVNDLRKNQMSYTVDILGEAVLSEKEASYYQNLYLELISGLSGEVLKWSNISLLDISPYGTLPKVNVSVKLSSLYSQADPVDFENSAALLKERLYPIFKLAKDCGAFVYLDMEDYHFKDLTLAVFKAILCEKEFITWEHAGIVIQAYLKDSESDLKNLIEWVKKRGVPITIRLVKGAYWDYETIISKQKRWPSPVFQNKNETDANFEKLIKILIDNYPVVFPAIASHNIRSLAFSKTYAEEKKLPKGALEYQFLFGMADPIKEAFVNFGERVRVYTPYGELIPGMAYLVRRLLENTANESFLRQGFAEGISEDELLKSPEAAKNIKLPVSKAHTSNLQKFLNEPDTDFTVLKNRYLMKSAIENFKKESEKKYPLIIDGKRIETDKWCNSINPSNYSEVIGKFSMADINHAEDAVNAAKCAFVNWSGTDVNYRTGILQKAAEIMRQRRFELSAVMTLEEGKPWREADGDVSEAIDFLNYYSLEVKRLFTFEKLISPLGEENYSFYQPRGITAVISPWNFPLAILTGMSSAALACGNTVILKPAKQASIIASKYAGILEEAGLPPGVCSYLPGDGKVIGNYLVKHKNVNVIAFTGSVEVGLSINKLAGEVFHRQDFVKKVICEMGGKNAIIVDADADLDEAVKGIIYSAFGYAGQKCSAASRVIVLKEVYEHFLERLTEAAKSIKVAASEDPASYLGPVIDKNAFENTKKYIEIGKSEGVMICGDGNVSANGYFISPTIFKDVKPDTRIAQEEIFAPVLAVIKAENFEDAINIANGVKFALTGGIFSRSPGNIKLAKAKFRVGNLYINRGSTGAKVGRQPFGGFKMSGIGSKAGGRDYLLQFVEPRVITENTMRRGFAPDEQT